MLVFSVCILTKQKMNINIHLPNYPKPKVSRKNIFIYTYMYSIGRYKINWKSATYFHAQRSGLQESALSTGQTSYNS